MQVIKPTSDQQNMENRISVFLAGSIEMGVAEDWQARAEKELIDLNVTIFNPRRDDWDSDWTQEESNPQFNYQVNWEMNKLEDADIIFVYFCPDTKSPITMMELGMHCRDEIMVCSPPGFWRRGNLEIVCTRHNIPLYDNFKEAIGALRTKIHQLSR